VQLPRASATPARSHSAAPEEWGKQRPRPPRRLQRSLLASAAYVTTTSAAASCCARCSPLFARCFSLSTCRSLPAAHSAPLSLGPPTSSRPVTPKGRRSDAFAARRPTNADPQGALSAGRARLTGPSGPDASELCSLAARKCRHAQLASSMGKNAPSAQTAALGRRTAPRPKLRDSERRQRVAPLCSAAAQRHSNGPAR